MNRIDVVSRRGFLGTVFSAGALVLGVQILPENAEAAEGSGAASWQPGVYLGLEPDGRVIITAHRSEMGTGVRTALPMVLADELDVDWKRVTIAQAIGDKKYGDQNTDGSTSIRSFYDAMRQSGATARLMLERAAAAQWNVPAGECKARNEQVTHASGRKASYGELVALAAKQQVPKKEELKLKTPAEFRYIGKGVPVTDQADIVAGKGHFGLDVRVPNMVYASIEHPPVFGGKVKSVDDGEARKVKGVQQTVQIPAFQPPYAFQPVGGVAVIADNTWAAMQGRKKLKVNWDLGPHVAYDSASYKTALFETVRKPQKVARNVGDVDAEFGKGGKIHEAEYYAPMLAHAPMEPVNAVAEFKDGKVTAWAPTQNPQAVQDTVAKALGIKPGDVTCNVTLLGGGFGRKSKPDYVAEAALLSKQVGRPVKVTWNREDDMQFDFFHAVAAMYMKASVDAKGRPTAWLQRCAFPPIESQNDVAARYGGFEQGMGWSDVPFDIPHMRAENGPAEAHVRIGWLRSVANIYHAFAVHSFADELAAAANRDRVEYLLDLVGKPRTLDVQSIPPNTPGYALETGRVRKVIEAVAEQSGWAKKKSTPGHGYGIAVHRSFQTYVAAVVEVEIDAKGAVRIPRVDYAVDTGLVVHPDRVRSQFEGAAVFGASLALMGEITAQGGRIQQSNYHNYPVARISEAPREVHVRLMQNDAPPAGVGEPGVPPIAPALCNAIFAATGKRIRELPIKKTKLV